MGPERTGQERHIPADYAGFNSTRFCIEAWVRRQVIKILDQIDRNFLSKGRRTHPPVVALEGARWSLKAYKNKIFQMVIESGRCRSCLLIVGEVLAESF